MYTCHKSLRIFLTSATPWPPMIRQGSITRNPKPGRFSFLPPFPETIARRATRVLLRPNKPFAWPNYRMVWRISGSPDEPSATFACISRQTLPEKARRPRRGQEPSKRTRTVGLSERFGGTVPRTMRSSSWTQLEPGRRSTRCSGMKIIGGH